MEGNSEIDGIILRRPPGVAENFDAYETDDRGDTVAIFVQIAEGLVAILDKVHLHAVDQLQKVFLRDFEVLQGFVQVGRNRMTWPSVEAGVGFGAPVGEVPGGGFT